MTTFKMCFKGDLMILNCHRKCVEFTSITIIYCISKKHDYGDASK